MDKSMIKVGDMHSHGGPVKSGSPESLLDGKPIARLGDLVDCPLHGVNEIIEASSGMDVDGQPAALHGDRTRCGATLIGGDSATVG